MTDTHAAPPPWLNPPGLRLRAFCAADADDVAALHREPRVRALLVDDHPLDEPAVARTFCARMAGFYRDHPGLGIWHAAMLEGGVWRFAGWFSLMPMEGQPGRVELGSRLLPRAWGAHWAMTGGEALLAHAFGTLGQPSVWGMCHPANRAARLCLLALGFSPQGMAPYSGGAALHHALDAAAWQLTCQRPRRERLRHAARTLHEPESVPA